MMFEERKSAAMRAQLVPSMRLLILGAIRQHSARMSKEELRLAAGVETDEEQAAFDTALEQLSEEGRVSPPYNRWRVGYGLGVMEWNYNSPTPIPGVYPMKYILKKETE